MSYASDPLLYFFKDWSARMIAEKRPPVHLMPAPRFQYRILYVGRNLGLFAFLKARFAWEELPVNLLPGGLAGPRPVTR